MDETEDLIVNHAMGALPISARPTTDIIGGFPEKSDNCKGCGKPLSLENASLTDGCPCNSPLGINSMNETRWRLLMAREHAQALHLAAAVERAEEWKRAAENQNRQWAAKCEEATELRAAKEQAERERDEHVRWMREMCADYRLAHDAHDVSMRLAINGFIHDLRADRDRLAAEVAALRALVAAAKCSDVDGLELMDVGGVNWWDARDAALSQPAPDSKDLK